MPKIIFTSRYTRNPKASNSGKLLRYMATRESVEKVAVGLDRSPSTVRQQRLIKNILEAFPETKDYLEYEDYLKEPCKSSTEDEQTPDQDTNEPCKPKFEAVQGKIRKAGTGCLYQVSENLWEGSYFPRLADGKRKKFNVYAKTREECEVLLAEMIPKVKAEIAEAKANRKVSQSA